MAVKYETELYPALKAFWTARGYEVKAEVRGCDLVALRPDEPMPVIVEMKKTFTLALLLQGLERQRTGAAVWLAVERNRAKKGAHNQRYGEIADMCRRLSLGFVTVTFYKTKPPVIEVWSEVGRRPGTGESSPVAAETSASYGPSSTGLAAAAASVRPAGRRKGTAKLLKEFAGRSGDYNVGGSTQRKLVTAYRERALQCALALRCDESPALAPRQIGALTGVANPGQLLRSNYYGWFRKAGRGLYALTPAGHAALTEYGEAVSYWTSVFPWAAKAMAAAGQPSVEAIAAEREPTASDESAAASDSLDESAVAWEPYVDDESAADRNQRGTDSPSAASGREPEEPDLQGARPAPYPTPEVLYR